MWSKSIVVVYHQFLILNITGFYRHYLLLGIFYFFFFLSCLLFRNLFLLVGILMWLSVRVPQFWIFVINLQEESGIKYWGTENLSSSGCLKDLSQSKDLNENSRISVLPCISVAAPLSLSHKAFTFMLKSSISTDCLFCKKHFQSIYVMSGGNIQYVKLMSSLCIYFVVSPAAGC